MKNSPNTKPAPKTNAEIQRDYVRRHKSTTSRLDMRINFEVNAYAVALAKHYKISKKELIERLLKAELDRVVGEFQKLGDAAFNEACDEFWLGKRSGEK